MFRNATLSLLASVFLLSSGGCKSETTPPPQAPETTGAATAESATISDTFGTLRSIHMAEVEHGTLAKNKATNARVKDFADKVVKDHKARMKKDDELMSALGISATDNEVSQRVKSASDKQTAKLESLSGADFDRAYIEEQINYYRMALDTFDNNLLPNVRDPQIKSQVSDARAKANEHLKEAQDIRLSLTNQ